MQALLNMINLILIRKEREPIRESYYRTYVYRVKNDMLYYKRFSWGRISENITERFKLSVNQIQRLESALNNPKLKSSQKDFVREDDSNLQLTYKIEIDHHGEEVVQHIDSPASHIYEKHQHVDELWRMIANFIPEKNLEPPYSPISPSLSLNLTFREIFRSKDSETKIRKYTLRGNALNIELIQKGRFRNEKKTQHQITDEWLAHIANYIIKEKEFVDGDWFKKTRQTPFTYLFPVIECDFSATLNGEQYSSTIKGDRFALLESIPFIVLESLEKMLDPQKEFHHSFEKEIRQQRFKKAIEKFEKESKK